MLNIGLFRLEPFRVWWAIWAHHLCTPVPAQVARFVAAAAWCHHPGLSRIFYIGCIHFSHLWLCLSVEVDKRLSIFDVHATHRSIEMFKLRGPLAVFVFLDSSPQHLVANPWRVGRAEVHERGKLCPDPLFDVLTLRSNWWWSCCKKWKGLNQSAA